jgi:hypothetical protein
LKCRRGQASAGGNDPVVYDSRSATGADTMKTHGNYIAGAQTEAAIADTQA